MSVVEKADHIIVLSDGMAKEEGSHDELLKKGGLYAELVRKQNMGFHRQEDTMNDAHWYVWAVVAGEAVQLLEGGWLNVQT